MKVWIENHRYIFNKYRDTIKCVLECIDESPIVKQMARLGTISEVYKCESRRCSFIMGVTFGNGIFKHNFRYGPIVYYRIPCGNVPAYIHTDIGIYNTTPILVQICILDSEDTWLVFNLRKKRASHSFCTDGGLKNYECLGL